MPYASVGGVDAYYETTGSGQPVLLLHGGFCSLEMMRPQGDALSERFAVYAPERPGHGRTADVDGPYSYAQGVDDTVAFMDAVGIDSAHVVGFSDGAIIGILLALQHPDRLRSLVAISGNLTPDGVVGFGSDSDADAESDVAADLDVEDGTPDASPDGAAEASVEEPDQPDEAWEHLRAEYHRLSPDGAEHEDIVLGKLFAMWKAEPDIDAAQLAAITAPTLIMAADHDVIRADHTRLMADSIPAAQLCIVPGATHMLVVERPALVNLVLVEFLDAASA